MKVNSKKIVLFSSVVIANLVAFALVYFLWFGFFNCVPKNWNCLTDDGGELIWVCTRDCRNFESVLFFLPTFLSFFGLIFGPFIVLKRFHRPR